MFECYYSGQYVSVKFNVTIWRGSNAYCIEFQRKSGDSILFNYCVASILKKLSQNYGQFNTFERSDIDMIVKPSVGFYIPPEAFEIENPIYFL